MNTVCHRVKTLPYLSDLNYFLLPLIRVENATRNLTLTNQRFEMLVFLKGAGQQPNEL